MGIQVFNPLEHYGNYNESMIISQVVKYFERQSIFFTKTMIQNYIKIKLLAKPEDKRYYVKNHMIMLVIIEDFKNVFALEEINSLFSLIYVEMNEFSNYTKNLEEIYNFYIEMKNVTFTKGINLPTPDNHSFYKIFKNMILTSNLKKSVIDMLI